MDYKKAAAYWTDKEADSKKLNRQDLLNSSFKEQGADSRQHLEINDHGK